MILHSQMTEIIIRFRRICYELYPNDIDVISPSVRSERIGIRYDNDLSKLLFSGNRLIDDVCRLTKTPRLLKLILRKTLRTWETLHGEIDFDDLLIANVIRFSAPEAFDFILNNIHEIRGLEFDSKYSEDRGKRLEAIDAKWNRTSKDVDWDVTSAMTLIKFLFPYWENSITSFDKNSFQRIYVNSPTDYWSRFLTGEIADEDIRDQEVIRCLLDWRENRDGPHFKGVSLPFILCNNLEFSLKFEYFDKFIVFSGTELRELASSLFAEAVTRYGIEADSDAVPGFIPLWRRVIRQPVDEDKHLSWVLSEIIKTMPKSFRFAINIYYYFRSNSESEIGIKQRRVDLWYKIVLMAKEIFIGKPDKFIQCIDPKFIYSSHQFYFNISDRKECESEWNHEELKWFIELLLEAGVLNPQTIVPQIADMVVEEKRHMGGFTYDFDWVYANKLFEGQQLRLMKILSIKIDLSCFNTREVELIKCANKVAKDWLEEQKIYPNKD